MFTSGHHCPPQTCLSLIGTLLISPQAFYSQGPSMLSLSYSPSSFSMRPLFHLPSSPLSLGFATSRPSATATGHRSISLHSRPRIPPFHTPSSRDTTLAFPVPILSPTKIDTQQSENNMDSGDGGKVISVVNQGSGLIIDVMDINQHQTLVCGLQSSPSFLCKLLVTHKLESTLIRT